MKIRCPGCDVELEERQLREQAEHMVEHHPEIVAERRAEAERLAGWEDAD
jgi:hypothetical protein